MSRIRQAMPWLRKFVGVAALVLAGIGAYSRRHELGDAAHLFTRINPFWLGIAIAAQAGSFVVFARLQYWLLRAGGVRVPLGQMVEITLAANALGTSLPGGVAWSGTWAYSQLRRRGADPVLTVWVLLVAGGLGSFALFVLLAVGSWLAGPGSPAGPVAPVTAVLAAIPVTAGTLWWAGQRSPAFRRALARAWQAIDRTVPGAPWAGRVVSGLIRRLATVQPGTRGWVEVFGMALANWVLDAACLACSLLALHVHLPWRDILFIYAVTQVVASLPITPGGLGVVEGSLALLLVAYHVPPADALAGVLLYRIASFWVLVPLGWIIWLVLEAAVRSGTRTRPHPWATHFHGPRPGEDTNRAPDLVLRTSPCMGCEGHEMAGSGAARGTE